MAALICENCGAPLEILTPDKLAECPYCRTKYTLPLRAEIDEKFLAKAAPYMERGRIYLADGLFSYAAEYFDKVLNLCPTYGEAYLLRGFCDLKVKSAADIDAKSRTGIFRNYYIIKAMAFLDMDKKNEFLEQMNMTLDEGDNAVYKTNWRKRALKVRQNFENKYKEAHPVFDSSMSVAANEIRDKYQGEIEKTKKQIVPVQKAVTGLENILSKTSVYDVGSTAYYNLQLEGKRKELYDLQRKLTNLQTEMQKEIDSSIPDNVNHETIDEQSIDALSGLFPIPELVLSDDALLTEKISDVLISRYQPFSEEEILNHPQLASSTDKRILASLKRQVSSKDIISYERDGTTYYVPTDIAWLFVPEEIL